MVVRPGTARSFLMVFINKSTIGAILQRPVYSAPAMRQRALDECTPTSSWPLGKVRVAPHVRGGAIQDKIISMLFQHITTGDFLIKKIRGWFADKLEICLDKGSSSRAVGENSFSTITRLVR